MAVAGWEVALSLAERKGSGADHGRGLHGDRRDAAQASGNGRDGYKVGDSASRAACCTPSTAATCSAWPRWRRNWWRSSAEVGARFTHHSSIAPTGTISLSLANNASNGIEPSFAHHYSRNVIREGKKSKEKVEVYSFELLAYRDLVNAKAMPYAT
jgi:ribonucleoside-diphosphate reductase alpha chain